MFSFEIDRQTLANLSSLPFEKDFSFNVGGTSFACSKFIACAMSTTVQDLIRIDMTVNTLCINVKDGHGVFSKIMQALNGDPVSFQPSEFQTLFSIASQLKSQQLTKYSLDCLVSNVTTHDAIELFNYLVSLNIDPSAIISFIAKNFTEIFYENAPQISILFMKQIVKNPSFSTSASELIPIIDKYCSKYGNEYAELTDAINTSSLSEMDIIKLVTLSNNETVRTHLISASINVLNDIITRVTNVQENKIIQPEFYGSINGIFSYLAEVTGSNICRNCTISLYAESNTMYLADLVDFGTNLKRHYKNDPNDGAGHIVFDMHEMQVSLSAYTIISCYCSEYGCEPRTWEIQGSNDLKKWTLVHRVEKNDSLVGKFIRGTFYLDHPTKLYRYFKYTQIENHTKTPIIHLSGFEFFGTLTGFTKEMLMSKVINPGNERANRHPSLDGD